MRLKALFIKALPVLLILSASSAHAQDFIEIWPHGHIPNSKRLPLKDSIANERIYRVMTPE